MGELTFRAGAGRGVIRYPRDVFPFREGPDNWTGIHDDPGVRVLILDCGVRMALVSLEVVILDKELEDEARRIAAEKTAVQPENVWLSATHSVTTPHLFVRDHDSDEEKARAKRLRQCILDALADAAGAAAANVQQAALGYGEGVCAANLNRMIPTRDGWWLGSGEEGAVDHTVPVVRVDGENGAPLAILYGYHTELAVMDKSVMADGGRHITADLAGAASRFVEEAYGDKAVAMFLPGVSTDQGPAYRAVRTVRGLDGSYREIDIKDAAWLLLELQGERLGEQVLMAAEKAVCKQLDEPIALHGRSFWFKGQKSRGPGIPRPQDGPLKTYDYPPAEDKTRSVEILRLGELVLVGVGGLGIRTWQRIQRESPFAHTILLSNVTGSMGRLPTDGEKGMAEEDLYEMVTFQSRNSEFAAGSAEQMRDHVIAFLRELKG